MSNPKKITLTLELTDLELEAAALPTTMARDLNYRYPEEHRLLLARARLEGKVEKAAMALRKDRGLLL